MTKVAKPPARIPSVKFEFSRTSTLAVSRTKNVYSIYCAQDFAAHSLGLRFAVAQNALTGRHDADAHPLQHDWQFARLLIDPTTGLADPLDFLNDSFAVGAVFQIDTQRLGGLTVNDFEIPDIAFAVQNLRDAHLFVRRGNIDKRALDRHRISD